MFSGVRERFSLGTNGLRGSQTDQLMISFMPTACGDNVYDFFSKSFLKECI